MDDKKLANYYDEQKAKGAGARFAKAGLGFASPGMGAQGRGMRPAGMDINGQNSAAATRPPLYADSTGVAPGAPPAGLSQAPTSQGAPFGNQAYAGAGQQPPSQLPPGPHPPFGARPPQGMQPAQGMQQHSHRPPFPQGMPPGGPPPRMPGMPPMHMGPPPGYMGMPYGMPGMPPQYGMPPMGMRPPPGMPPPGMPGPPRGFPQRPSGPPSFPAAQRPHGPPMSQPQQLPGPPRPVQHVGLLASHGGAPSSQPAPAALPVAPSVEPASAAPWHLAPGGASTDPTASVRAAIAAESKAEEEKAQKAKEASAWIAHKTGDGQVYYYNTLTNESSWEKPTDYAGDSSKASAQLTPVSTQPVKGTEWSEVVCADGRRYYFNAGTQETSWVAPSEVKAVLEKKPKLPGSLTGISPAAAAHLERSQDKQSAVGNDEDASFSLDDIQPAKSRAAAPKKVASIQKSVQELTQEFKDLLSEKGVTPFSRWEKELPKLIADPRYTAVGSLKERRLIFDDFCKTSADEHKRGKAERARKSREDFQALLEEAAIAGTLENDENGKSFPSITADTTLSELAEHWSGDARWQACEEKLRAELLEAKVAPLRLAKAKAEEESEERKKAREASYRELLKEKKVAAGARWSKTKDSLAGDKRYKALARDQRENLFRQFVAERELSKGQMEETWAHCLRTLEEAWAMALCHYEDLCTF